MKAHCVVGIRACCSSLGNYELGNLAPTRNDKVCLWKMSPGLDLSARVLQNSGLSQDCLHCSCLGCDHLKLQGQVGQGRKDSLPEWGVLGHVLSLCQWVHCVPTSTQPWRLALWHLVWEDWGEGWRCTFITKFCLVWRPVYSFSAGMCVCVCVLEG